MFYKKIVSFILVLCLIAFNFSGCDVTETSSSPQVEGNLIAEFLDVGQGDSTLFTLPDGKILLIDAANNNDGDSILSYIKSKGIAKIDYLVATHPHADHIGGLDEIISGIDVGQIFAPKIADKDIPTTKAYENFLNAVLNKNLSITTAKSGSLLFEGEDYKAECLAPTQTEKNDLNNYSVVIKLTFGKQAFLLTGDAEAEVERELLSTTANLKADVLKVGHHGSSTSNTIEFLKKVSPQYAVISCGEDNSYGHPHYEVTQRLKLCSAEILRTDLMQTIVITANGTDSITYTKNNPTVVGE